MRILRVEWTRKKKQKQDVQQYAAFLPECTVQTLWLARDPTADRTVPRRRCLTYTSTCISNVMARFVKKQAHHWRSIIACCTHHEIKNKDRHRKVKDFSTLSCCYTTLTEEPTSANACCNRKRSCKRGRTSRTSSNSCKRVAMKLVTLHPLDRCKKCSRKCHCQAVPKRTRDNCPPRRRVPYYRHRQCPANCANS